MLTVSDLCCFYGSTPVLRVPRFDVDRGEIVAIIGRNGCGKSTFLRAILGLVPATGAIHVGDEAVRAQPDECVRRYGLSLLPQEQRVVRTLSVRENLALAASRRPRAFQADLKRWLSALSDGEIASLGPPWDALQCLASPILDRLAVGADRLSGGESACVGLACAILACRWCLLLDEPSAGASKRMLEWFALSIERLAASRHYSVVLAEQNHELVLRVAHRVFIVTRERTSDTSSMVEVPATLLSCSRDLPSPPRDLVSWLEGEMCLSDEATRSRTAGSYLEERTDDQAG